MRKKILTIAAALFVSFAAMAQIPTPPTKMGTNNLQTPNSVNDTVRNGGASAPVAPATLLLLGLAGGAAGIKLYRNSKSND